MHETMSLIMVLSTMLNLWVVDRALINDGRSVVSCVSILSSGGKIDAVTEGAKHFCEVRVHDRVAQLHRSHALICMKLCASTAI